MMRILSGILLIAGAVLAAYGLLTLGDAPEIVGGDAFNFMIGSLRAVGRIAAGGVCAAIGVGCAVLDGFDPERATPTRTTKGD
jgi:hypothetical protein